MTYPFPKFKVATVELWEGISNFNSHYIAHLITSTCWYWIKSVLVKGRPGVKITLAVVYRYPTPDGYILSITVPYSWLRARNIPDHSSASYRIYLRHDGWFWQPLRPERVGYDSKIHHISKPNVASYSHKMLSIIRTYFVSNTYSVYGLSVILFLCSIAWYGLYRYHYSLFCKLVPTHPSHSNESWIANYMLDNYPPE